MILVRILLDVCLLWPLGWPQLNRSGFVTLVPCNPGLPRRSCDEQQDPSAGEGGVQGGKDPDQEFWDRYFEGRPTLTWEEVLALDDQEPRAAGEAA